MRTFDFAPLYRSTVGFDRLFDMMDQAARVDGSASWPPYNIEKLADDAYRITLAVAGFAPDEIDLTQNGNSLLVSGQKKDAEGQHQFLHRGIAGRQFRQTFNLADHVKVTGARMENGLLVVECERCRRRSSRGASRSAAPRWLPARPTLSRRSRIRSRPLEPPRNR
jgi:molecular chaperone IbpA